MMCALRSVNSTDHYQNSSHQYDQPTQILPVAKKLGIPPRGRPPSEKTTGPRKQYRREWMKECGRLLETLMKMDDSVPFREPVDCLKYPDFYSVIAEPIDLSKIMLKYRGNNYANPEQFATDVRQLFTDYKFFFKDPESKVYSQTQNLSWWFESEYDRIAEKWGPYKLKRKTGQSSSQEDSPKSDVNNSFEQHSPPIGSQHNPTQQRVNYSNPNLLQPPLETGRSHAPYLHDRSLSDPIVPTSMQPDYMIHQFSRTHLMNNTYNTSHAHSPLRQMGPSPSLPSSIQSTHHKLMRMSSIEEDDIPGDPRHMHPHNPPQHPQIKQPEDNYASTHSRMQTDNSQGHGHMQSASPAQSRMQSGSPAQSRMQTGSPAQSRMQTSSPAQSRMQTGSPAQSRMQNDNAPHSRMQTDDNYIPSQNERPENSANIPPPAPQPPQNTHITAPGKLELKLEVSNMWFGGTRVKPADLVVLNSQGISLLISRDNLEIPFLIKTQEIVRLSGLLGRMKKNIIFLFVLPSCTKRLEQISPAYSDSSMIILFTPHLTIEHSSCFYHIVNKMKRLSLFGELFSEIEQKEAFVLMANIKPGLLERTAAKAKDIGVSKLKNEARPNLTNRNAPMIRAASEGGTPLDLSRPLEIPPHRQSRVNKPRFRFLDRVGNTSFDAGDGDPNGPEGKLRPPSLRVANLGSSNEDEVASVDMDSCQDEMEILEVMDPDESVSGTKHVKDMEDSSLNDKGSLKCPISLQNIKIPVHNKHCAHIYDREGVEQLIRHRDQRARCPVKGCSNMIPLHLEDMLFTAEPPERNIRQNQHPGFDVP